MLFPLDQVNSRIFLCVPKIGVLLKPVEIINDPKEVIYMSTNEDIVWKV